MSYQKFEYLLNLRDPKGKVVRSALKESDMFTTMRNPKSSRMLEMRNFRQSPGSWEFERLFRVFGAMPCSVPQDRVFALLGLVTQQDENVLLSRIIDYELTVWQLLHRILHSGALLEPIIFTYHYAKNVIMATKDVHMRDLISVPLRNHLQLPEQYESNCMDSGMELQQPHVCMQQFDSVIESDAVDAQMSRGTLFLYAWSSNPPQAYTMVALPGTHLPLKESNPALYTYVLIEPCEDNCQLGCVGHPAVGLALSLLWDARHPGRSTKEAMINAMTTAIKPPTLGNARRSHSIFHARMHEKHLPEALNSFKQSTSIVKITPTQHRLDTDLATLVRLAKLVYDMQEGIALEISIPIPWEYWPQNPV
jgi:hypothetical protein